MSEYHIAQINIARMLAPIDSDVMTGFVARLDEINALADSAEGFVWRLQTEEGDATSLRVFDDEMLIINMSVWESVDALHTYTYRTEHAQLIKQRKDWFSRLDSHHMVIWYIPAGHIPTPKEAQAKLALLDEQGETPTAFTFKTRFSVDEWRALENDV